MSEIYPLLDFLETESNAERKAVKLQGLVELTIKHTAPNSAVLKCMMGVGFLIVSRAPPGRTAGLLMSPSLSASLFHQHYAGL